MKQHTLKDIKDQINEKFAHQQLNMIIVVYVFSGRGQSREWLQF